MKNWKGVLAILLMSVLSLGFSLSAFAAETDALQLKSKSAVLMDAGTGAILYEKNSHEAMPPASVTKVMTLLLIYEAEAAGQFEYGWLTGFSGVGRNADSRRADEMYRDCICE